MSRTLPRTGVVLPFATTLRVRDSCLCLHVQRAARGLARRFDDAFRPVNLTNGQFSLLMSLNRPKPPGMGPIAELLGMDRTTLTAALKPLERRGFVTIRPDPTDRRSRLLTLTPRGNNSWPAPCRSGNASARSWNRFCLTGLPSCALTSARLRDPGPLDAVRCTLSP